MKWFQNIETLKDLRKEYRRIVVKHHPDNGGSEDTIKEINAEYNTLFKRLKNDFEHKDTYSKATDKQKQQYDWQKDAQIRDIIMQLSIFKDITVEIIGVWIWVSNCYEYRKELKALGFRWASQNRCSASSASSPAPVAHWRWLSHRPPARCRLLPHFPPSVSNQTTRRNCAD